MDSPKTQRFKEKYEDDIEDLKYFVKRHCMKFTFTGNKCDNKYFAHGNTIQSTASLIQEFMEYKDQKYDVTSKIISVQRFNKYLKCLDLFSDDRMNTGHCCQRHLMSKKLYIRVIQDRHVAENSPKERNRISTIEAKRRNRLGEFELKYNMSNKLYNCIKDCDCWKPIYSINGTVNGPATRALALKNYRDYQINEVAKKCLPKIKLQIEAYQNATRKTFDTYANIDPNNLDDPEAGMIDIHKAESEFYNEDDVDMKYPFHKYIIIKDNFEYIIGKCNLHMGAKYVLKIYRHFKFDLLKEYCDEAHTKIKRINKKYKQRTTTGYRYKRKIKNDFDLLNDLEISEEDNDIDDISITLFEDSEEFEDQGDIIPNEMINDAMGETCNKNDIKQDFGEIKYKKNMSGKMAKLVLAPKSQNNLTNDLERLLNNTNRECPYPAKVTIKYTNTFEEVREPILVSNNVTFHLGKIYYRENNQGSVVVETVNSDTIKIKIKMCNQVNERSQKYRMVNTGSGKKLVEWMCGFGITYDENCIDDTPEPEFNLFNPICIYFNKTGEPQNWTAMPS